MQLSFVRMYVLPVATKQLAHFCSITVTRNAAKRSEFVDIDYCIDLLFNIGVWVSDNSKKASCTV